MARDLTLDVRGMEPPEPLQRVLETHRRLRAGRPAESSSSTASRMPLYRILDRNGYAHDTVPGTVSQREITIWRR